MPPSAKKRIWFSVTIVYLFVSIYVLFFKPKDHYIFLFNITEQMWFLLFNMIMIGTLSIYFIKLFHPNLFTSNVRFYSISLLIIFTLVGGFLKIMFLQTEVFSINDPVLPSTFKVVVHVGFLDDYMIFYEKKGLFLYKKTNSHPVRKGSWDDLQDHTYKINVKEKSIEFFDGRTYELWKK